MGIEHDSAVPLYVQIKNFIRLHIQAGRYPAASRMPSERELAKQFDVSRLTVTKALKELEQEGLIYTQIGKGTYVATAAKIDQELKTLRSFSEEMHAQRKSAVSLVLAAQVIPAPDAVASALQIPPGEAVFSLKRVRLADGKPIALEHAHIIYALCAGIDGHDFEYESLYRVLKEKYGLLLTLAHQTIEARLASAEEAEVLEIPALTPVLSFTRVTLNELNQPIEFVLSSYPGDRYKLHTTLTP